MAREATTTLRRGWTTGACAAAAAGAAYSAMLTGGFPDPATLRLPRGSIASFPLVLAEFNNGGARAGIRKDAGDDPDVTHGALVVAEVSPETPGSGIVFAAGEGVGTVSRPGLPLAVGEPAINPAPRAMIRETLLNIAVAHGAAPLDVTVRISIPGGERLAERTMNARLGIIGGLSILGTSGIVIPYSCASWIHSIHRGIDVARAAGLGHIAAATGATSERAVQRLYSLPDHALIDMGDFVGATLKYLRRHPVARVTIAGGFAKLTKLAGGHLDLHSGKGGVDIPALATLLAELGADPQSLEGVRTARTAAEILAIADDKREALVYRIAAGAREVALATLSGETAVEVAITNRQGEFVARVGGWQPSDS
ncbi:MAG: cobalt-precorrin-5B (C(1))-methyltransferase [Stellaceae bacterium]